MSNSDEYPVESSRRPSARSSRRGQRRKGPRLWVELDEYGEPVPLDQDQETRLRERAQNLCLWHLGQGPRTRKQLMDAMRKHGVPVDMADGVLDRLADYNYVNDTAYADNYVRSRHEVQRKGAALIRRELRQKGVADEVVEAALEQVTPESEQESARRLVQQKVSSTRGLEHTKRVNRLVGMLSRRGYPPGVAFQVVREVLSEEDETFPDLDADTNVDSLPPLG